MKIRNFIPILIIVILSSCNKDDATILEKSRLLTLQEIEKLGVEHNNILDKVLIGLKENKVSFKKDKDNIETILNKELNTLYETNLNTNKEIVTAIEYSEKEVSRFAIKAHQSFLKNSKSQSSLQIIIREYSENLTESQQNFLIQIDEVLSQTTNDVEATLSKLNSIQEIVQSELSVEEAQVVLAGAEIGKASLQYWSENIEEWQQVLDKGGIQQKGWLDWSELGGSDVAGAVGGAIGAAVVNIVPGAGQVAYGAAILGGAAGASATDAVMQIWNHYL